MDFGVNKKPRLHIQLVSDMTGFPILGTRAWDCVFWHRSTQCLLCHVLCWLMRGIMMSQPAPVNQSKTLVTSMKDRKLTGDFTFAFLRLPHFKKADLYFLPFNYLWKPLQVRDLHEANDYSEWWWQCEGQVIGTSWNFFSSWDGPIRCNRERFLNPGCTIPMVLISSKELQTKRWSGILQQPLRKAGNLWAQHKMGQAGS